MEANWEDTLAALIEALTAAIAEDIEDICNWSESMRVDVMLVEVNKLLELLKILEVGVIDPIKVLLEVPVIDSLIALLVLFKEFFELDPVIADVEVVLLEVVEFKVATIDMSWLTCDIMLDISGLREVVEVMLDASEEREVIKTEEVNEDELLAVLVILLELVKFAALVVVFVERMDENEAIKALETEAEALETKLDAETLALEMIEALLTEALDAIPAETLETWATAAEEALEAIEAEIKEAAFEAEDTEANIEETLAEAWDKMDETLTVGEAVTVLVTVELNAARAEVMLVAAKREATGPVVGKPVNEEP